jgi:hypothetical protein
MRNRIVWYNVGDVSVEPGASIFSAEERSQSREYQSLRNIGIETPIYNKQTNSVALSPRANYTD